MRLQRTLLLASLALFSLSSCEKIKPFARKLRAALERDEVPVQVSGLPAPPETAEPEPPEAVKMEPEINRDARVAILGYHDFTESRRPTDMIIPINDFRSQMQTLRKVGLPVISMRDFLAWKQGKKDIPAQSVIITIDDGWLDTHTLAMPVLQQFGYPFTVFLYKNYIGVGGRSMDVEQIKDLVSAGATIGSHSVSHQFMNRSAGRTPEKYDAWLRAELRDSFTFLLDHFGPEPVLPAFAYPFGAFNPKVLELTAEADYEVAFTVSPGKVAWGDNPLLLPRYIIHGDNPKTFDAAIQFGGGAGSAASSHLLFTDQRREEGGEPQKPLVEVYPPNGAVVKNRLPRIEVNLSQLSRVQPESLELRIGGFGKVPHLYSPETKTVSYQVPQRLRSSLCAVQITFRHAGNKNVEQIGWSFAIDRKSEYLDPAATSVRPPGRAVDPRQDLVLPAAEDVATNLPRDGVTEPGVSAAPANPPSQQESKPAPETSGTASGNPLRTARDLDPLHDL